MTWGVSNSDKGSDPEKKVKAFPNHQLSQVVPVVSDYASYPTKEVFHTAITLIVAGIICVGIGIGHVVVTPDMGEEDAQIFHSGYPIWTGIIFIVAGALAFESCRRRTRGRIIATTVLASLTILVALCVGIHLLRSLFLARWFDSVHPEYPPLGDGGDDSGEDDDDDDKGGKGKKVWWFRFSWWFRIKKGVNCTWYEWKIRHRHHRHKRMSQIEQQMYDDPAYFATTVCLLVALVTIIAASVNLLIHCINTLKKGRHRDLDVYNGNATPEETKQSNAGRASPALKRYLRLSIAMIVFGVLSCLLGIGQTVGAMVDRPFYTDLHFSLWLTGYPVWMSVWFILTGVYGLRACKDDNLQTLCQLIHPIVAIIISGCMIGYTGWSVFAKYDRSGWGDMYECPLYMAFATCLATVDAAVFISAILLVAFVAKLCKERKRTQEESVKTKVASIRIHQYKLDLFNGNAE